MKLKLDFTSLRAAYAEGLTPSQVVDTIYDRLEQGEINPVWISLVPRAQASAKANQLEKSTEKSLPLFGIPFAVKDNIDVAGMETTAACPAFAYRAEETAFVVKRLEEAGAILIGKTNLDQFATGLVGVRSPYGACASVFDDRYISGGSSSGSAVAVASGLVSFSLGTDTAGSGRVPAAFNNLIGLKPTRGSLSASGVVPACRSLDCVSIFALTNADAWDVFQAARGYDAEDAFSSIEAATNAPTPWLGQSFTFGVPQRDQWEFFGDAEAEQLYAASISALESVGGVAVEFDYRPFRETAVLLYSGPWVAERLAALKPFFDEHVGEAHPVVEKIIRGAAKHTAVDTFLAEYQLQELRRQAGKVWLNADMLLLPTTGTIYTRKAVEADPITLNTNLGYYTNFVNLLDLAAVALPGGFRPNGLPFGVTLMGQPRTEHALLCVADTLHRALSTPSDSPGAVAPLPTPATPLGCVLVAVVGAHLTGQPLNHQLTTRGARFVETTRTAPGYRLYALPNTTPPKPGLARIPGFTGNGIEVEVWAMPLESFGAFVAEVPVPLGIGNVELANGATVKGFVCEPFAIADAADITHYGGWRGYLTKE